MAKCLNEGCSNEVVTKEGKRARKTCSDSCRQQLWQKNKQASDFVKISREDYEKFLQRHTEDMLFPKNTDDRTNPLINAARGRDESGINEDEVRISPKIDKKIEKSTLPLPKQNKKEFRAIMKGESGLDYSLAKREFLNNQ